MTAMPASTDTVANFPLLLTFPNRNYSSNDLMARDARKRFAKLALLEEAIGVTNATSLHLDQDLAGLGRRNRDLFDLPRRAGFLDDDRAARGRNIRG